MGFHHKMWRIQSDIGTISRKGQICELTRFNIKDISLPVNPKLQERRRNQTSVIVAEQSWKKVFFLEQSLLAIFWFHLPHLRAVREFP
jgi:hypothetical protein